MFLWKEAAAMICRRNGFTLIELLAVNANIPPKGVWFCPSFNPTDLVNEANKPECYGPGTIDLGDLGRQYYAHYGIVSPPPVGPQGSCTRDDPHFNYTGSDPIYTDT